MTEDRKYIRIFYTIIAFITLFKFGMSSITTGLDVSWVYAINRFFNEGVLWGHDVMFTYGPLGFIICPMNIGSNAIISLAYWIFMAVSAGLIFSYIFFSERNSVISSRKDNILISFTLFYLGSCVFGRLSSEYANTFMILCLLSLCWLSGKIKFLFMASLLCVLSLFTKFNSGAIDMMTIVMFALMFRPSKYLPVLLIIPVLFLICFMIYNPSLMELYYYVRGAYEISSGYISAMSLTLHIKMAVFFLMCSVVLAVILIKADFFRIKHSFKYAMLFAIPVFGLFKHAFTRADGHMLMFMPNLCCWLSVYVLFMHHELHMRRLFSKILKVCLCAAFAVSFVVSLTGLNDADYRFQFVIRNALTNPLFEFWNNVSSVRDIKDIKDARELKLPSEFIETISNDTMTIYPFEISFAEDIPNYKPMPICQAYSAYTSWLDEQNAEFFSEDNAPKFIVFNTDAIDARFPLIECPQSWLEIFRRYAIRLHDMDKHLFLLERREERKLESHNKITQIYSRDDVIDIPTRERLCIMNADMKLNLMGKFMKLIYKIPAVLMTAEFDDGRLITKRVLPEVLNNDTIISHLILDDKNFASFMNGDMSTGKVKSIRFSGDGLKYYASDITIKFTELTE